MTDVLTIAIIVVSLGAALYSLVTTFRDRPMGWPDIAAIAVVEVLLIVQAVIAGIKIAGGEGPQDSVTFVGYLVGILLIPTVGVGWGLLERSRWGPAVLVVAALSVAVMTERMRQIWTGTGG
ncbi:hypothetical protein DPM19_00260 [Actinomadura craniellae]|uniref:Integral membrane protein n=1 Tax=Actinomadura craniellae TaxID=2231787 RepID=A0A365HCD7_9ACTN|nr:hypothetical protein [Actinomadura craniellae]RAY16658.1 hypothetical protein DPM19_00260 [Actinomadura craniellae]